MPYDPKSDHRRSIRLKGYDYTQPGAYFITLCTSHRACLFGEVINTEIHLDTVGQIASREWQHLGCRFTQVEFSEFTVMPNHIHGIIVIHEARRGAGAVSQFHHSGNSPLRPTVTPGSLGAIVRAYKSAVTYRINNLRGHSLPPVWQRNYYEHIIRSEEDFREIAEYIQNNPARWAEDSLNPASTKNY